MLNNYEFNTIMEGEFCKIIIYEWIMEGESM